MIYLSMKAYADFQVRLDAPNINPVSVGYQTDVNTATYSSSQDFVFTSGTLNFAPGGDSKDRAGHDDEWLHCGSD